MIVLIPVSQYRVRYELGSGRPYSHFEQMLLNAIQRGASTIAELGEIFAIHQRLIIEGLVTLTQAGWIAILGDESKGFVLTPEGKFAADQESLPPTTLIRSSTSYILLERLTGAILPRDEVRFVTKRDLGPQWDNCVRIRPETTYNSLDEGQVQHLLRKRQGEWIRWVGPIDMTSKDSNWIPVNFDVTQERISGLPDRIKMRLEPIVLDAARGYASENPTEINEETWTILPPRRTSAPSDKGIRTHGTESIAQLLTDETEHLSFLLHALEKADHSVLIASGNINANWITKNAVSISTSLQRGVSIDILWGTTESAEDDREVTRLLQKLSFDSRGLSGSLCFNTSPSPVRANVVIADTKGSYIASTGSFPWLGDSSKDDSSSKFASLQFSHQGVIARLIRCLTGIWSSIESELFATSINRWRLISSELEEKLKGATDSAESGISIILDQEHWQLPIATQPTVGEEKILISSAVSSDYSNPLMRSFADPSAPARIVVPSGLGGAVRNIFSPIKDSIEIDELDGIRANILINGESVTITSCGLLSTHFSSSADQVRHIGITVIDEALRHSVMKKFIAL